MTTPRVIFKDEGTDREGRTIGPVTVLKEGQSTKRERKLGHEPYEPICACEKPNGMVRCKDCGAKIERWVTHEDAQALANEFGVELEEV